MNIKSLALIALASLVGVGAASAQFAPVPSNPNTHITYRTAVTGLVTAASATDVITISGSATKNTVNVRKIECSGIATTAGTADIVAIKRSAVNTGGTSTQPAKVALDANNTVASGAVVNAYTANPSALGTTVGAIRSEKLPLPLAATGGSMNKLSWDFGQNLYTRPVTLRGVNQVLAINANGATLAAGAALDCSIEWTEN